MSRQTPSETLARFGDIEISVEDFNAHVLAMPLDRRPVPEEDIDAWKREQIRDIILQRVFLGEARKAGIHAEKSFQRKRLEAEKMIASRLCLRARLAESFPLDEERLRAEYEARKVEFAKPERRFVYHLFRRYLEDEDREDVRREVLSLRERVMRGENFSKLAEMHSDSETRHRKGLIGWVMPGQLPEGFERAIFNLKERIPGMPVITRDGVHLFYVDSILPAKQPSFEDVLPDLRRQLNLSRIDRMLQEMADQVADDFDVPTREAFFGLNGTVDDSVVVMRNGEFELTVDDLRRFLSERMARETSAPATSSRDECWRLLKDLQMREKVLSYCQCKDLIPDKERAEALEKWERRTLISLQRRRRMLDVIRSDEASLASFFRNHIDMFSSPQCWHFKRLTVPISDDASGVFALLETVAAEQKRSLEGIQAEVGGEIEDLGMLSLSELKMVDPKLATLIGPMAENQLSPPYRQENHWAVARLMERKEPSPLPLEQIVDQVASAFLDMHTSEVFGRLIAEVFAGEEPVVVPEVLASLDERAVFLEPISEHDLNMLLEETP